MTISRNDACWCGSGKKWKKCHFPKAATLSQKEDYLKKFGIILKTPEEIAGIRRACHLAAEILDKTCALAKEGVTTNELNDFAHRLHTEAGALPAPLGYGDPPFPKSICTSLNDTICHGIPNDEPLKKGDILNIDVTCILNHYFGDCSKMVQIGAIAEEKKRVMHVSYDCLMEAIQILKPGVMVCEIGDRIEAYASSHQCSVVYQFVGHGVGLHFHEAPQIPHHRNDVEIPLAEGMIFTIEPMINAGSPSARIDPKDHWTARTVDGKPSAQYEHTLLIIKDGYEILTPWKM